MGQVTSGMFFVKLVEEGINFWVYRLARLSSGGSLEGIASCRAGWGIGVMGYGGIGICCMNQSGVIIAYGLNIAPPGTPGPSGVAEEAGVECVMFSGG